jgi:hypothetical protein
MLFPFATANPHYVMAQYHACAAKLLVAALPDRAFCDIRGVFWAIGWIIPQSRLALMQVSAAAGTLGLCVLAKRWWNEPHRAVFIAAFSACYLMLFNPRTEENSYVILAGILAVPTAMHYVDRRRFSAGAALVCIGFWFSGDGWAYRLTDPWLKPLACMIFTIVLIRKLFRRDIGRFSSSAEGQLEHFSAQPTGLTPAAASTVE